MKKKRIAIFCAALVIVMAFAGCSAAPAVTAAPAGTAAPAVTTAVNSSPMMITVAASSTVRLVPDKATVTFGVTSQEKTAQEAQDANSKAVNNVIAVLTERGIEEKSIRTNSYSIYPQYDWKNGEQRLIGYSVTTTMSVQDQEIDAVGNLIAACVAAGINRVDSVTFLCSGYEEAYSQALAEATEETRKKAETLANAAGKKLGDPITITEGWQDTSAKYGRNVANVSYDTAIAEEEPEAPTFQPGETEINASVTVVYEMR